MKRKSVVVALLSLLLLLPLLAEAAPVGKFTNIEGRVDVTAPGKTAVAANPGDTLQPGDIIRTKSKSKAEVVFIDGSILRMAANSRLRVSEFSRDQQSRSAVLNLFRGKIQNSVQKMTGAAASKYEIHTPTAVCGVRGTQFYTYYQSGISGTVVTEGTVYGYSTNAPDQIRSIGPNQTMIVTDPGLPPRVRESSPTEMEQHQKDTTLSEKPEKRSNEQEERKPETVEAATGDDQQEGTENQEDTQGETQEARSDENQSGKEPIKAQGEENSPAGTTDASNQGLAGGEPVREDGGKSTAVAAANATVNDRAGPVDVVSQDLAATIARIVIETPQPAPSSVVGSQPQPPTPPYVPPTPADTKVPVITAVSLPPEIANINTPKFVYTTDEPVTIRFNLDGQGWVSGQPALDNEFVITLSELADGRHTLVFQATDKARNEATATCIFTIDTAPPVINLSDVPAPITNLSNADIGVTAGQDATITYTLNGAPLSSASLTNLPEGQNTFIVTATDTAGNQASQTVSWTTDYTPPALALSGIPAPITNQTSATIGVTTGQDATATYTLNGTPVSSTSLTNLPEGQNTFIVTATDAAGNQASQAVSWTTDYTPPVLALTAKPPALTNVGSPLFQTHSTEAGTTLSYLLDGAPVAGSGDTISFTGLSEGSHTMSVQGTDGAGNRADSLSYFWTIDLTKPVASLAPSSLPGKVTGDAGSKFVFNAADIYLDNTYYRVDGGPWELFFDTPLNFPEGLRRIDFLADDLAGNVSDIAAETSYEWFIGKIQYLLQGAVAGGVNGSIMPSSEGLRTISSGTAGAWLIDMSGNYDVLPAGFNLTAGGHRYGPDNPSLFAGYWLSQGSALAADGGLISGTSTFFLLSPSTLGSGTGVLSGSFTGSASAGGAWQAQDLGLGTYQETPLAFAATLSGEGQRYDASLASIAASGTVEGLLGGALSLFDAFRATDNTYSPTPLTGLGMVQSDTIYPLARMMIAGNELSDPAANGYLALFGGRSEENGPGMQGEIAGLYWKNLDETTSETGIVTSNAVGLSLHPGIGMWQIAPGAELIARPLANDLASPAFDVRSSLQEGIASAATALSGFQGMLAINAIAGEEISFSHRNWGVALDTMGGSYDYGNLVNDIFTPLPLPPGANWIAEIDFTDTARFDSYTVEATTGNEWEGTAAGAKVDWISARTAVSGETIKGLFNPVQATWQSIAAGGWVETGTFRELQATAAGRAALDALHIPAILVGRTELTGAVDLGTAGSMTVTMRDVAFFAYSTGTPARIWASGADTGNPATSGVSGSYTGAPAPGWTVPLTGGNYSNTSGINGNFVVNTWDNGANGVWGAKVTGSGMIGPESARDPIIFTGAAAGNVTTVPNGTPGTFTGSGAGVVAPAQ